VHICQTERRHRTGQSPLAKPQFHARSTHITRFAARRDNRIQKTSFNPVHSKTDRNTEAIFKNYELFIWGEISYILTHFV
jgi:hypothetical protein